MRLPNLPDHSRIWIYQANRPLTTGEQEVVERQLDVFAQQWKAHGAALNAGATVVHGLWLVIAVDESGTAASGCSIDAKVHHIREVGTQLGIDFFTRTTIGWLHDEELRLAPMHEFWAMRKAGLIDDHTKVFNNLAADLGTFKRQPFVPFADSWHAEVWR